MVPKPLVFVPGLPGTKLIDEASGRELFPNLLGLISSQRDLLLARLRGPDDPDADDGVVPGEPIDTVIPLLPFLDLDGLLKHAASLYDILGGLGYQIAGGSFGDRFRPVGWDWRRPVDQQGTLARVKAAIVELNDALGERVTVLCHSTGGLVARSLFAAEPALAARVERVLALGVPWAGTLDPLPLLSGQSGWVALTPDATRRTLDHSWAAFDLLPPDPAKTDMTDVDLFRDAAGRPSSPLVDTSWIPADDHLQAARVRAASADARLGRRSRTLDLGDVEIVDVVGRGADTLTRCSLDGQGRPVFAHSPEGDGTIPRSSAAWLEGPRVRTYLVPIGHYPNDQLGRKHIVLWENPPVRDLLATLLTDRPQPPYVYAAVDADDAVDVDKPRVRVYTVALDAAGVPLPGAFSTVAGSPTEFGFGPDGLGMMLLDRALAENAGHGFFRLEVRFHDAQGDPLGMPQALTIQGPAEI